MAKLVVAFCEYRGWTCTDDSYDWAEDARDYPVGLGDTKEEAIAEFKAEKFEKCLKCNPNDLKGCSDCVEVYENEFEGEKIPDLCTFCSGSGEGMTQGTICFVCKGRGRNNE